MLPLISVIVPIYKVELYIRKCIDSIINQTYQNLEIILVDDGSPDRCPDICDEYAQKDSRIKVIHKQNGGLSDARNAGLDIAKGEYIVFLDSDDLLSLSAMDSIFNAIKSYSHPDLIMNRYQYFTDDICYSIECAFKYDTKLLSDLSADKVFEHCLSLSGFICTAWMLVYKTRYIQINGFRFVKDLLHEDEQWTPRLMLNATSIGFNNEVLYCYRKNRPNSIIGTMNIQKSFDKLFIIDNLMAEAEKSSYSKLAKDLLKRRCGDLYTSILYELEDYRKVGHIDIKKLAVAMQERTYVLLYLRTFKHYLGWLGCGMLGVLKFSKLKSTLWNRAVKHRDYVWIGRLL